MNWISFVYGFGAGAATVIAIAVGYVIYTMIRDNVGVQ
jgi:hypothetical protein